nr:glycosyltransferase family 4 protein [Kineococcus vitellinus]
MLPRGGFATDGRPRVLHLGYEDPRKPGAGGGSVRTAEVNSRLAAEFDVLVVCAPFPGCAPYEQDGVRYVHAGAGGSYNAQVMSYFAAQPLVVARTRPDLVVEDFGAPLSTFGLPRLTRRPVVGVVQWLFADEKAQQYRLPFGHVQRHGVAAHRTLVAVSEDLGDRLREANPAAAVHVVPNGLPPQAFGTPRPPADRSGGLRFLGRVEDAQKGIGMLLEAYARVAGSLPQDLLIAGEGPDRARMERLAEHLGLAHRVRFVGHVPLGDRFAWLAAADAVVMPSRYETFGMVAAEAMAVGTPVVAFDIPCLRGLVSDRTGRRVPAFDVAALAAAIGELAGDPALRARLGAAGRAAVHHLTWDNAARAHADLYRKVLKEHA